jgi:SRSO17 transposase
VDLEAGALRPRRRAGGGGRGPQQGRDRLAELDRLRAAGARFGIVLADAGYGAGAEFRRGLDERGQRWAVGIPRNQKVYGAGVRLVPPAGRRARRPVPDEEPREAEAVLAGCRGGA